MSNVYSNLTDARVLRVFSLGLFAVRPGKAANLRISKGEEGEGGRGRGGNKTRSSGKKINRKIISKKLN